jgi:hypothetical protein
VGVQKGVGVDENVSGANDEWSVRVCKKVWVWMKTCLGLTVSGACGREVQPVRGPEKINMVLGCPVEAAQGRSGEPGNCRGDSPCDFRGTR